MTAELFHLGMQPTMEYKPNSHPRFLSLLLQLPVWLAMFSDSSRAKTGGERKGKGATEISI
jgi:hypothetical protein